MTMHIKRQAINSQSLSNSQIDEAGYNINSDRNQGQVTQKEVQ